MAALVVGLPVIALAACTLTPRESLVVTPAPGRQAPVTRRYTIQEIEQGSAAYRPPANPLDIPHPVYPGKEQLETLKRQIQEGDQVWYFRGLDSGWAIVRNREVMWVLVTNHEW
jgi:hypothetical protein